MQRQETDGSMRVLHILNHGLPTQDGYVYRTHGLLEGQRAHGIETFHLTSPRHEHPIARPLEEIDGWRFYRTEHGLRAKAPLFRELMEMRATARRIEAVAAEVRPDLIQAHSPLLNGYPALWAAHRLGVPMVYEIRAFWEDAAVDQGSTRENSARYRAIRRLETELCRRADGVTVICNGLRGALIERGVDPEKIQVIPNAVEPGRFSEITAPEPALVRSYGLEDCSVLGFIGSFYAYEGLSLLIDAMPRLLESRPELRLLLVGGGLEDQALRERAAQRGLDGKVVFTGRIPHDQALAHYGLIDLCVYPRLPMPLTELVTPLKPLEALAAGRVVVASDVGGHRELIRDGETGYLFKAGYLTALIDRLNEALASRERWPHIRANGRMMVAARSWRAVSAAYRPMFERLCRNRISA
jgi:PEP-CTERM/exosortase A-associated glycosyltransferase